VNDSISPLSSSDPAGSDGEYYSSVPSGFPSGLVFVGFGSGSDFLGGFSAGAGYSYPGPVIAHTLMPQK